MKMLSTSDLEDLALGSSILGSGGGGNPAYDLLMAKEQFQKYKGVELVSVSSLKDDDLVVPVAFMGAPLVCIEKIPSGREFDQIIDKIEETLGKKVTHLMAAEIGGANAFTPLIAAAKRRMKVLDADTLGRAFPELQMSSCNLHKISPTPSILADSLGNCITLDLQDTFALERFCRRITVEMGSNAAVSTYLMTGKQAKKAVISGSVTRAINIGRTLKNSNEPIECLIKTHGAKKLCAGMIIDVNQQVLDGFLKGTFTILDENKKVVVHYQNEFLMVEREGIPLASTPDIIMPLEQETGTPITSESLQYGLRVVLVGLQSPELWRTEKGLETVGPKVFGYEIDYNKIKI